MKQGEMGKPGEENTIKIKGGLSVNGWGKGLGHQGCKVPAQPPGQKVMIDNWGKKKTRNNPEEPQRHRSTEQRREKRSNASPDSKGTRSREFGRTKNRVRGIPTSNPAHSIKRTEREMLGGSKVGTGKEKKFERWEKKPIGRTVCPKMAQLQGAIEKPGGGNSQYTKKGTPGYCR